MNNLILYVGVLSLLLAIVLDGFAAIWGYQSAFGKKYKSGNFLIPAILYLIFIFTTNVEVIKNNQVAFSCLMVLVHCFIYFILPWLFDVLARKNRG